MRIKKLVSRAAVAIASLVVLALFLWYCRCCFRLINEWVRVPAEPVHIREEKP